MIIHFIKTLDWPINYIIFCLQTLYVSSLTFALLHKVFRILLENNVCQLTTISISNTTFYFFAVIVGIHLILLD